MELLTYNENTSTYPIHLVPQKDFKFIKEVDKSDFLGKFVNPDVDLKDPDGTLSAEAIETKRLPGFSTNKLPHSLSSDLKIAFICEKGIKDNYTKEWNEGEEGICPDDAHWQLEEDRKIYYFRIGDIDGFSGDYQNPPTEKGDEYKFFVQVIHKPTMTNFWHFEFYISNDRKEAIDVLNDKGWRKTVSSAIRSKLQEIAVFELD